MSLSQRFLNSKKISLNKNKNEIKIMNFGNILKNV